MAQQSMKQSGTPLTCVADCLRLMMDLFPRIKAYYEKNSAHKPHIWNRWLKVLDDCSVEEIDAVFCEWLEDFPERAVVEPIQHLSRRIREKRNADRPPPVRHRTQPSTVPDSNMAESFSRGAEAIAAGNREQLQEILKGVR